MTEPPSLPPPGWYAEGGRMRWWDGNAWTDQYAPDPADARDPRPALASAAPPVSSEATTPVVPPKKPMSGCTGCLLLFVIVAVIGGGCGLLLGGSDDGGNNVEIAKYTCRDAVKDQLNAPSTAKFRNESSSGSGPYTVHGTVEAENVLGGRISKSYSCIVTDSGKGYQSAVSSIG